MIMDWETIARQISHAASTKIVLLVMDGLGGLPVNGQTELEAADTPHLDALAARSACGVTDPVLMGVTPGSGPSHLALFGYSPTKYLLGRGILEALGVEGEDGQDHEQSEHADRVDRSQRKGGPLLAVRHALGESRLHQR